MKHFCNSGSFFIIIAMLLLGACDGGGGGGEDSTIPVVTLTSPNGGEEVVGTYPITWNNKESFPSTVKIELSTDSGDNFLPANVIAERAPDIGSYSWDSNSSPDCRRCLIRITAIDIARNISNPVVSSADFIINNVPQVIGSALFYDKGNNGVGDGDTIVIPFDKAVELRTSVAGDVFFLPVVGDEIGAFSILSLGSSVNDVVIKINDLLWPNFHLHVSGVFDSEKIRRTFPSGLDILDNLAGDIIFSIETGRTAEPLGDGIDIVPTFGEVLTAGAAVMGNTSNTVAVAVADLNNDNVLDIVRINTTGDDAILLNNGPATWLDDDTDTANNFTTSTAIGMSNVKNTSVAVADIDGGNGPDIVIGNSDKNLVFINDGAGGFLEKTQPVSFTSAINTQAVALADVDNANGVDVIAGINGINRLFLNDGTDSGSFNDSGQTLGNSDTIAITTGDVNGDGYQDLVTANNGANRIWINSKVNPGNFDLDQSYSFGDSDSNTRAVVLANIDKDDDLDLITGNRGGPNRVWINNIRNLDSEKGVFSENEPAQELGNDDTESVIMYDVDNDGDLDLITGNRGQSDRVWFNDGKGVFSDSGQRLNTENPGSSGTVSIAIGDLDGDKDADLVVGSVGGISTDTIWLNSLAIPSKPYLINSNQPLGSNSTNAMVAGDVNNDGLLDIVTGNGSSEGNKVYISDAKGLFTDSGQSLGSNKTTSVVLVDIDDDKDLDIIAGNTSAQANRVWLNDNNNPGQFIAGDEFGGSNTTSMAVGDIDNKNGPDIVVGNSLSQANRVWLNNGMGVFDTNNMTSLMDSDDTSSVALGNVDGDVNSSLDLVIGNYGSPNRVYTNDGNGIFTESQPPLGGNADTTSIALHDIDDDGDLDMVEAVYGQPNRVWINNINNLDSEKGIFSEESPAQALGGNNNTNSVALADIDGDGDSDLVFGNAGAANDIWLNRNINSGVFINSGQTFDSSNTDSTFSVLFVDIDEDGDPDILTGNDGALGGINQLWLNDL